MIKYQKTDRQFILNAINPQHNRKAKPRYAPNKFSYFRTQDDHIHFGITHQTHPSCKSRPDLSTFNATMIENLEKKYHFCSVSASQDKETGLDIIIQKVRWNECDDCKKILWKEDRKANDFYRIDFRIVHDKGRTRSLCLKCFRKDWRVNKEGNFVKKEKKNE